MDFAQIYSFLFESFAGIGVLVGIVLVIGIVACVIWEVRTRKAFALNEQNGFRSCTMFNLGIVAERLGRGFEFDPETLHAVDDEAAERFLYQDDRMREPWKKEMFG